MIADPPRFVADVAAQVVAWHNRHPLARRITRKDVQGVGIVVLPFARDGQARWDAPQAKRSLLALLFPPRKRRRQWPAFSEDLVPEIGTQRLARFALRHGQEQRPGPADLPERVAVVDRDLLDEGGKGAEFPPERLDRYLVTAAIDIGPSRPRLMLGSGKRPAVLGQRLWSLPRLALLGGGFLLAMVIGAAGLWMKAMPQRNAAGAAKPSATSAAASAAVQRPAAASSAPASPPVSAASVAAEAASTPQPVARGAPPARSPVTAAASRPASAAASTHVTPAGSQVQHPPASPAAPASSTAITAAVPAVPAASASGPPQTIVERASEPLVPRLRPDLAASARAEGTPRAPAAPGGSAAPSSPALAPPPGGTLPPRAAPPSPPAAAHFYALVTRPVRTKPEGEAMLRRLRAETDRIAHPTATQTALQESRDGWRATWWPFTNPRQAENARQALARRIELEVIEF